MVSSSISYTGHNMDGMKRKRIPVQRGLSCLLNVLFHFTTVITESRGLHMKSTCFSEFYTLSFACDAENINSFSFLTCSRVLRFRIFLWQRNENTIPKVNVTRNTKPPTTTIMVLTEVESTVGSGK